MVQHKAVWGRMGSVGMIVVAWSLAHTGADDAAERGRTLYAQYCAVCHGAEGQGRVEGNASSLNNPDFLVVASTAFLQTTIVRGRRGTAMHGWALAAGGPLSREEIHDPVTYLRRMVAGPEVSRAQ